MYAYHAMPALSRVGALIRVLNPVEFPCVGIR